MAGARATEIGGAGAPGRSGARPYADVVVVIVTGARGSEESGGGSAGERPVSETYSSFVV